MTERLKQLLDDEAHDLSVPPPSAAKAVLRQGRGLRRRNRIADGRCGAAAAVLVGRQRRRPSRATAATRPLPIPAGRPVSGNAVFSYGNQVFYDGPGTGRRSRTTPSSRCTTPPPACSSATVTTLQRRRRPAAVLAGDARGRGEAARAEDRGDRARQRPRPAVRRLRRGSRRRAPGRRLRRRSGCRSGPGDRRDRPMDSWFPVALDGDTVYVQNGYEDGIFAVDWRAGTASGRTSRASGRSPAGTPVSRPAGRRRSSTPRPGTCSDSVDSDGYFDLSPDGRYAQLVIEDEEGRRLRVRGLRRRYRRVGDLRGPPVQWGWTADGDLFKVEKDRVRTCDTATGECTRRGLHTSPTSPTLSPVTPTMSDPVCPDGNQDCYNDEVFLNNCYEHPDECEWHGERVRRRPVRPSLKLAGRAYES